MIRRVLMFLAIALALGALLLASQWWQRRPPTVSGFIEAHEIRLGSRVGGRVAKVRVDEGDRVELGQVLVELEPYDLRARLAEAQATLAARQADYQRLKEGFRSEEITQAKQHYEQLKARHEEMVAGPRQPEIEAARQRVAAAEAELKLAQHQYDRTKTLFERNATSRDEMDRAIAQLSVARHTLAVRREELKLLEEGTRPEVIAAAKAQMEEALAEWKLRQSGYRQEDVEQAKAQVEAARAAIDVIEQQLDELRVHAPLAGVIETMELRPGDLVAAGSPVMSMFDTSELWVRSYLPADMRLTVGDRLPISVDGFPNRRFEGEVTFIADEAEFTPMNVQTPEDRAKQVFRFKATLREGLDVLRPGMLATVWLDEE